MSKSYLAKPKEVKRNCYLVDARGKVLGRFAARVATILQGKHKPTYTPGVDCGDHVIVINAAGIRVTGRKMQQKMYQRYSGYPGGLKQRPLEEELKKDPTRVLRRAVKGMIPGNRLGRQMLKKLKIYPGAEHPHQAQKPEVLDISQRGSN